MILLSKLQLFEFCGRVSLVGHFSLHLELPSLASPVSSMGRLRYFNGALYSGDLGVGISLHFLASPVVFTRA